LPYYSLKSQTMKTILFILISCLGFFAQAQTDYTGDYSGKLNAMGSELPLVFHITQKSGDYKATMDSPNQGAFDIPVAVNFLKNDSLSLKIAAAQISYNGNFIQKDSISGTFIQAGKEIPLNLKKGNVKGPERPQNPEKPYPYDETEVTFKNKNAGIQLAGTFTRPKKAENIPAVILVTGSGPQDRNSALMGHKPFLVLADYLTRNGVAVLRYDERGVGESEGKFKGATTYDFAEDAAAGLDFLSQQEGVDKNKLGIIGHSEGGAVAQVLAVRNPKLDFAIMLAGPGIPGDEILLQQKRMIDEKSGVSEKEITKGTALNRGAFDLVKKTPLNELKEKLETYFRENGMTEETKISQMTTSLNNPWMKEFLSFDPGQFLKNTNLPMLALLGYKDVQVPAESNAKALENFPNVKVKIFTGLNHLFQKANTGLPNEYATIKQTISPDVLNTIKEFIKNQN